MCLMTMSREFSGWSCGTCAILFLIFFLHKDENKRQSVVDEFHRRSSIGVMMMMMMTMMMMMMMVMISKVMSTKMMRTRTVTTKEHENECDDKKVILITITITIIIISLPSHHHHHHHYHPHHQLIIIILIIIRFELHHLSRPQGYNRPKRKPIDLPASSKRRAKSFCEKRGMR